MPRFWALIVLVFVVLAPRVAHADAPPWCAPEIEALQGDACYLDGYRADAPKRTLVIFLGGAAAAGKTWQWNHMRGVQKLAQGIGFEAIYPRSPLTGRGYVWPEHSWGKPAEDELIDGWMAAKRELEKRRGRAFDEVFVFGFSSGAYFASSLALRGRLDVDGYAVFAGGLPAGAQKAPLVRWSPVFVGVCGEDEASAPHSRAFAAVLAAAGIPRVVDTQPVGHGLSHVHVHHALAYLRGALAAGKPAPLASRE
jgi:predicted esterase